MTAAVRLGPLLIALCLAAPAALGQEAAQDTAEGPASREVRPLDASALRAELDARHGRVVVLNMWATWCPPCVAEFPHLVEFAREVSPEQVAVMAITSDYLPDLETKVLPFLEEQDPPFPVFLQQDRDDDFFPAVDPDWMGAFPHTVIYNPDGSIRSRIDVIHSAQELHDAVASPESEVTGEEVSAAE